MTATTFDLRRHPRIRLEPMYSSITVRRSSDDYDLEGHAYDLSESGVRIELDEPLEPGERISVSLSLPGESTAVHVAGRVVWTHDAEDDPAARRGAVEFTCFLSGDDRVRLMRYLGSGVGRLAA